MEKTVALIYDFDGTLSPGNMQEYDFIPAVGKSNKEFWNDANILAETQDADPVLTYMARMIQEAQSKGLSLRREAFQESGRNIVYYNGVEGWFPRMNAYAAERGIRLLHYINSSGMKEIIEGTSIAHEFKHIYACSFRHSWPVGDAIDIVEERAGIDILKLVGNGSALDNLLETRRVDIVQDVDATLSAILIDTLEPLDYTIVESYVTSRFAEGLTAQ